MLLQIILLKRLTERPYNYVKISKCYHFDIYFLKVAFDYSPYSMLSLDAIFSGIAWCNEILEDYFLHS